MNHDDEGFSTLDAKQALRSLKSLSAEPSPFLKTRLLRQLSHEPQEQVRNQVETKLYLLKRFFVPIILTVSVVISLIFFVDKFKLEAATLNPVYKTGQSYVIRVDIRPLKEAKISYAEIELSDRNIKFTSTEVIEAIQQQKLVVAWENIVEKQFLPIVIQGTKPGASTVIINFYDLENKLVKSQNVKLDFKGG